MKPERLKKLRSHITSMLWPYPSDEMHAREALALIDAELAAPAHTDATVAEMAVTIERLRGELDSNEASYEALLKDYILVRKGVMTAIIP